MTIDKAIEYLMIIEGKLWEDSNRGSVPCDGISAIYLGIEALRRVKRKRKQMPGFFCSYEETIEYMHPSWLPGETEEIETRDAFMERCRQAVVKL